MASTTASHHAIDGSCSCGRNQFAIYIPSADTTSALVILDNSAASRRTHASPLTPFLSIPLTYYKSATIAYYPDETHRAIRRVYNVPPSTSPAPSQQRHFCGFCGTHFAAWDEPLAAQRDADGDSERIRVPLESVSDDSFNTLYALGILRNGSDDDEDGDFLGEEEEEGADITMRDGTGNNEDGTADAVRNRGVFVAPRHTGGAGRSYFEDMVDGSRLQRYRAGTAPDGTQWEIIEEVVSPGTTTKRKREGEAEAS